MRVRKSSKANIRRRDRRRRHKAHIQEAPGKTRGFLLIAFVESDDWFGAGCHRAAGPRLARRWVADGRVVLLDVSGRALHDQVIRIRAKRVVSSRPSGRVAAFAGPRHPRPRPAHANERPASPLALDLSLIHISEPTRLGM